MFGNLFLILMASKICRRFFVFSSVFCCLFVFVFWWGTIFRYDLGVIFEDFRITADVDSCVLLICVVVIYYLMALILGRWCIR